MGLYARLTRIVAAALLASACGGPPSVVVGGKDFTEQVVLGEMLAQLLEIEGIPVTRRLNLGGTFICHQAMLAGELDLYVEYSGTAWTAILREPPNRDKSAIAKALRDRYPAELGLAWGERLGFDNSFAVIARPELSVRTISELGEHQRTLRIAAGHEFLERGDGYRGLVSAYGLDFATEPTAVSFGLMYQALEEGKVDVVIGSATDGLIEKLGLRVLEDDLSFFLPYEASVVYRPELLDTFPAIGSVLASVSGILDGEAMRRLNLLVDEGGDPRAVVRAYLRNRGVSPID